MVKKEIRFARIILLIVMLISTVISCFTVQFPVLASSGTAFDNTDVLADLRSSEGFDIADYPIKEDAEFQMIQFEEYCYSCYANKRDNYGLYVYIYNPALKNVSQDSSLNRIEMASKYNEQGEPVEWHKYRLEFCSVSIESDYYKLFYKFKVVDERTSDGKTIAERVNSNERRYDISGIELLTTGETNAHEFTVGIYFTCTGYVAGLGPVDSDIDTTTLKMDNLESVMLDVNHTTWRDTTGRVDYCQTQVNSVYFKVPKKLFDKYGNLKRVKADWWEYLTKEILVLDNEEYYNEALKYVGTNPAYEGIHYWYHSRDVHETSENYWSWAGSREERELHWILPTLGFADIKEFSPYSSIEEIGGVSSERLMEYMYNYPLSTTVPNVKDGLISGDLFEDHISPYREATYYEKDKSIRGQIQRGYSYLDFDIELDTKDLKSFTQEYIKKQEFYSKYNYEPEQLSNILFRIYGEEILTPFKILTAEDVFANEELTEENKEIMVDKLYIGYEDCQDIKDAFIDAHLDSAGECELVLFRFAVSDYYSQPVRICEAPIYPDADIEIVKILSDDSAYVAKETVFLDFDVIQLTFNRNEQFKVIPAVSTPIDIVSGLTPPIHSNGCQNALGTIILIILLAIAIWLLWPYLPAIFKGIWTVLKWIAIGIYYVIAWPYVLAKKATEKDEE